jgi:K+-sensing histidine kinase KdpD
VSFSLGNKNKTNYCFAALCLLLLTAVLKVLGSHINSTTVALTFLLVVLFVATRLGARPAVLASITSMLIFNFFFMPPFGTLTITNSDNWIALGAFLLTAVTVGQLSARAKHRAEEAEAGRLEIERLYQELQAAFQRASLAEALRQSERLKSALLDAITHDIRTPLTSIKVSVTTLLDELHSRKEGIATLNEEDKKEMLEVIEEETDRLNKFAESLIELARIDAGEMHLQPRWGAVDEIISAALDRAKPLTSNHEIEILLEDKLPNVQVDGRAVAQVIYTLIDNAVKYSPVGTFIYISAYKGECGTVRIMVEDHGQGIPQELRERVFDKFYRAMRENDQSNPPPSGTGMGLAIARGIIEAHNGHIWIEGGGDELGTRVVFTLPIGKQETVSVMELQKVDLKGSNRAPGL